MSTCTVCVYTVDLELLVPIAHCNHSHDNSIGRLESQVNFNGIRLCVRLHCSNTKIT